MLSIVSFILFGTSIAQRLNSISDSSNNFLSNSLNQIDCSNSECIPDLSKCGCFVQNFTGYDQYKSSFFRGSVKSACLQSSRKNLFTYQFNKQSRWGFGNSMSSENHFMMLGAPMSAFPLEVAIEVIDPSLTKIASVQILPSRRSP